MMVFMVLDYALTVYLRNIVPYLNIYELLGPPSHIIPAVYNPY